MGQLFSHYCHHHKYVEAKSKNKQLKKLSNTTSKITSKLNIFLTEHMVDDIVDVYIEKRSL